MSLRGLFTRERTVDARADNDRGILVFENTSDVIAAERILKKGFDIRVMGPPPEVRSGCDLVIEFPLMEELLILRLIREEGLFPLEAVPVTGPLLEPVSLFQVTDMGEFLMVRAANMKIAVNRASRMIVNVSGGGCPDIPYLAHLMVGCTLDDTPDPQDIGHTLCGYALKLAFEEAKRRCLPL